MNTANRDETYYANCLQCGWSLKTKSISQRGAESRVHASDNAHPVQMIDRVVYPTLVMHPQS